MRKYIIIAIALLIPVVIAGCLLTGTIVLSFNLTGGWTSNGAMQSRAVNLSENSDYQDNKDKLKSVDAVVLVGDIANSGASDLTTQVYISENLYTTAAQVQTNATRIFVSPTVPANDTLHLNWSDGMAHVENFATIENEIKGDRQFYVYAISSSSTAITYNLDLIVTLTVGK